MKTLIVPLAGFGLAMLIAGAAEAASPAYCALYAREYANETVQPSAAPGMLQSVQDQAYYRCLNQDEDPQLPQTSAYFGTDVGDPVALETTGAIGTDASPAPATSPAPAAASKPVSVAQRTQHSRSGLTPWSKEWASWCSRHYPRSFDPKTGLVLPYKSNNWEFC